MSEESNKEGGGSVVSSPARSETDPSPCSRSSRSSGVSPLFNYPPVLPRSTSNVSVVVSPMERRASMPDLSVDAMRQVYQMIVSDKTPQNWMIVGISRGGKEVKLTVLSGSGDIETLKPHLNPEHLVFIFIRVLYGKVKKNILIDFVPDGNMGDRYNRILASAKPKIYDCIKHHVSISPVNKIEDITTGEVWKTMFNVLTTDRLLIKVTVMERTLDNLVPKDCFLVDLDLSGTVDDLKQQVREKKPELSEQKMKVWFLIEAPKGKTTKFGLVEDFTCDLIDDAKSLRSYGLAFYDQVFLEVLHELLPPPNPEGLARIESIMLQHAVSPHATNEENKEGSDSTQAQGERGEIQAVQEEMLREISLDEIMIIQRNVGFGKTAKVHKALWLVENIDIAYKELQYSTPSMADPQRRERILKPFREELQLLQKLNHRNIVILVGACTDTNHLCVFTEWVRRGCLHNVICDPKTTMSLRVVLQILLDIARGMRYLHSQKVLHRDLKPHNLLVDHDWTVKVADFGTAKMVNQLDTIAYTEVGTAFFKAPECGALQGYSREVDFYSYGKCLWQIMWRCGIPMAAREDSQLELPFWAPSPIVSLMQRCIRIVPSERATFAEAVDILEGLLEDDQLAALEAIDVPCKGEGSA